MLVEILQDRCRHARSVASSQIVFFVEPETDVHLFLHGQPVGDLPFSIGHEFLGDCNGVFLVGHGFRLYQIFGNLKVFFFSINLGLNFFHDFTV